MVTLPDAAKASLCSLLLTLSVTGCSAIGFVGGSGVNAVRGHRSLELPADSLFTLRDGSQVTLHLTDSTHVTGKKLHPLRSDYDSTGSLSAPLVFRLLRTAKTDSLKGDTLLVPLTQVTGASVPARHTADRTAAVAGAKADIVVLKAALVLAVAAAVVVGLFGLILSSSGFSF